MRFNNQAGLSLVELMVAMTLGIVLTAAVINIFISSKTTYTVLNGQASMQENGRFAVDFIRQDVQKAGFRTVPFQTQIIGQQILDANGQKITKNADWMNNYELEQSYPAQGIFLKGQVVAGGAGDASAKAGTDFLAVRYQRDEDGNLYDCLGAVIPRRADNNVSVVTAKFYISITDQLMCQVSLDGAAPSAAVPLVDSVKNLKVLFGIGNGGNVTSYTNDITGHETSVFAVQFALLAASDKQTATPASTATFNLLGTTVGPFPDRSLLQVFAQTVKLRNVPRIAQN